VTSKTPLDTTLDTPLAARLNVAIYVPLVLLALVGVFLYGQVARLSTSARWMDHSDKIIAKVYEAQKLIIDQETGIRGYLVTEDRTFLQHFNEAHPKVPIADLRMLVDDNPSQQARVDELRRQYESWFAEEQHEVLQGALGPARADATMLSRKKEMDDIRAVVDSIIEAENLLRAERTVGVDDANRSAQLVVVSFLLAAGVVIAFVSRRQIAAAAASFDVTLQRERLARTAIERQEWMRSAQMRVSSAIQGEMGVADIGTRALACLAEETGAEVGVFYVAEPGGFRRYASHAVEAPEAFAARDGLVGQAGSENKLVHLKDVPRDFLRIRSGSGERSPVEVIIAPLSIDRTVHAVVELGFLRPPSSESIELLDRVSEIVAVAVRSAAYRKDLRELLDETQAQGAALQSQKDALSASNEELEEQTEALREAQQELELQQVELEQTNERLDQSAQILGRQNDDLKKAQEELVLRAAEVARSNQYKSEFLANMSHELRTPLNSSLILSKLLADNKAGNLSDEQVRFAETIYTAGNDLLDLINDILDLSKIEAGKMEVDVTVSPFSRVLEPVQRLFEPVAHEKGLLLESSVLEAGIVETDIQKVQQILKNLLSNALKFTEKGTVSVRVSGDIGRVTVAVTDSGIGIADAQHELIFEAFRQADGTTNRKYGGTGLGLSISRDLAHLLGGDLVVASEIGRGSTFTLTFPRNYRGPVAVAPAVTATASPARATAAASKPAESVDARSPSVDDDRNALEANARLILVIEDDAPFARILVDLIHERGFQCVVAGGADEGVRLATKLAPRAILLDVGLPDHSGLSALERLKRNAVTRHIPVHVMSVSDYSETALAMGAVGFALKPVRREEVVRALTELEARGSSRVRRLLIVEDDRPQRDAIAKLLGSAEVEIIGVGTVEEALSQLRSSTFDCVVTDLSLPDESGYALLEHMAEDDACSFPPVIVYTGRSLTREEEQKLRKYSSTIIVKGARSPERLLDEVTLFLHQVESSLSPDRQRMLRQVRDREAIFDGRRILVVEDDVRNIFAITSVLEPKGATIEIARNGREALTFLEKHRDIDLVLMDIMMPEMDGITCMVEIRKRAQWAKLPIIALTAKAMKHDQERCLEAGANDYISKPLHVETLLSLLRVWMPR